MNAKAITASERKMARIAVDMAYRVAAQTEFDQWGPWAGGWGLGIVFGSRCEFATSWTPVTEQSDGSAWVATSQVWYGLTESFEYLVVPAEAGYRIAQLRMR